MGDWLCDVADHCGSMHGTKKSKYSQLDPATYNDDDLARIGAVYAAEKGRGAARLYWEDVQMGVSLGQMAKGPLTTTDIVNFHAGRLRLGARTISSSSPASWWKRASSRACCWSISRRR